MPHRAPHAPAAPSVPAESQNRWSPVGRHLLDLSPLVQSAARAAHYLIGAVLVHHTEQGLRAGRIVETEAYDQTDPASHSFRGPTPRTQVMFGPAGHAYVYRSYGLHWCINVSCGQEGFGAAVLLRALAPLAGCGLMARDRKFAPAQLGAFGDAPLKATDLRRLCQGPGNLTQAMGITNACGGAPLHQGSLVLYQGDGLLPDEVICQGPRVGISVAQEVPWRFYLENNRFVSGPRSRPTTASHRA